MNWEPQRAVKAGRAIANMTQSELAQKLSTVSGEKWTRDKVANLERGEKTFDVDTLRHVARVQGLPYSFYLEGITSDNPGYVDLDPATPLYALRNSNEAHDPVTDAIWLAINRGDRESVA